MRHKTQRPMEMISGLFLLLLTACHHVVPVKNFQDQPIPNAGKLSSDEVARQIKLAGSSLGWTLTDIGPGKMRGVLDVKSHEAAIQVDYTSSTYSIMMASSERLNQTADGSINRHYNDWVSRLKQKIDQQLQSASLVKN